VFGVVISFFIQPVDADMAALMQHEKDKKETDVFAEAAEETTGDDAAPSTFETLLSAPRLLFSDLRMLLLVPLIVYSGFEMAFMWFDFYGNPVKTHLGGNNVGYIAAILAAIDAVLSFVLSNFAAKLAEIKIGASRKPLGPIAFLPFVLLGIGAHCLVTVLLFPGANLLKLPFATDELAVDWVETSKFGTPDYSPNAWYGEPECSNIDCNTDSGKTWGLFIFISALWAIGDAVANTMLQNIIGSYFTGWKTAAAFANLKVFQALATAGAAGFNYHGIIHANVKSWVMVCTYAAAVSCYVIVVFLDPIVKKCSGRSATTAGDGAQPLLA
jgi:hypothetical protein